jgi:hypothetical protein
MDLHPMLSDWRLAELSFVVLVEPDGPVVSVYTT